MKTVSLDVHSETSQLVAVSEDGEILLEMKVSTQAEELRRIIEGIPGPKRVVLEQGPMSGMIHDALADVADEIISCDPTQNALIARSEKKNDELDARQLAKLARLGALCKVYVPPEPYRTLRSLLVHDYHLMQKMTGGKNRIKGMCRRHGIRCHGVSVYREANREDAQRQLPNAALRWQMESLYRELDMLSTERRGAHRMLGDVCRDIPEVELLASIPGVDRDPFPLPLGCRPQVVRRSRARPGLHQLAADWPCAGFQARATKVETCTLDRRVCRDQGEERLRATL